MEEYITYAEKYLFWNISVRTKENSAILQKIIIFLT